MGKRFLVVVLMICAVIMMTGCGFKQLDTEKISDLDFTVVDSDGIPEELASEIELQKENAFTLTYMDGDYLYLARGYGMQDTSGYSISVTELYLTEDSIYFDTELIGPKKGENVSTAATYPYVVVKTERREESVIFG